MDSLDVYAFPSFALIQQVLSKVMISANLSMILGAPVWQLKEWFSDFLAFGRFFRAPHAVESVGSALLKEILHGSRITMPSCIEAVKQFVYKAGFCEEVEDLATDGKSRVCLHHGK